jgi:hypothetical protein
MEIQFDFTVDDNEYIHIFNLTTNLHILQINQSLAILYFTDEINNKTQIPNDVVVYTYDHQNVKKKVVCNPIGQAYPLCWTDNYTIELNKVVIMTITNQRKWNIRNTLKFYPY